MDVLASIMDLLMMSLGARFALGIALAVLGLGILLKKLYRMFIYPHYVSPLRHLPGPKDHHFLVGQHINDFRSGHPNEPFVSWMKQWPRADFIRYFGFANSELLLLNSIAAHKDLLVTNGYSFVKPPFFSRLIKDNIGMGVVLSEGEPHRRQRRFFADLFSVARLKKMLPVFQSKARDLVQLFDAVAGNKDGIVELTSTYSKLMLDVMGIFALGIELKNLETASEYSFHDGYHELFDPGPVGQVFMGLQTLLPTGIRWLPVEPNRRFNKAKSTVHNQLRAIIRQRIAEVKKDSNSTIIYDKGEIMDMLTHMVRHRYFAVEGQEHWTEQEILEQILVFMAGGHETAASMLLWSTYVLASRPDINARLRAEAVDLLTRKPDPDYTDFEALHYMRNFYREILRVYCPATTSPRQAVKDIVIQGVLIPKGTSIMIQPSVLLRNPTIWGENSDHFDPDRWDRLEGEAADGIAFSPFLHGPHACIGRAMSMLEFKAILVEVVSRFDFELLDHKVGEPVPVLNPSPVLRPKGGMTVKVKRVTH